MMQSLLPSALALALAALLGAGPGVYTGAAAPGATGEAEMGMCYASSTGHALGGGTAHRGWIALPAARGNDGSEPEMEREGPSVLAHATPPPVLAGAAGPPRGPDAGRAPVSPLHLLELTSHPPTAPPQHA